MYQKPFSHYLILVASWFLASIVNAGEAYILQLGSEGCSTVVVAENAATAFLTDGGRRSGGITDAGIGGMNVLTFLANRNIEHLVVTCSHPHDDHISGLIQFLKSDGILTLDKLTRVDFVESGHGEDEKGTKSLAEIYEGHWNGKSRRPPQSTSFPATNKNAFNDIPQPTDVLVENLVYEPEGKAGPHGRSVVTIYRLTGPEGETRLVDFDDADTFVVARFAEWALRDPAKRRPHVAIMPHHGTRLSATDVTPLFADAIRPTDVVFSVNASNRYLHPHPETVQFCLGIDNIGRDHTHFTAGSKNIIVTSKGVRRNEEGDSLSQFLKVIIPKQESVETKTTALVQIQEQGRLTDGQERSLRRYSNWLAGINSIRDNWADPKLMAQGNTSHASRSSGLNSNIGDFWRAYIENRKAVSIAKNVGRGNGGVGAVGQGGGGGSSFSIMTRIRPVFGGVILGNKFIANDEVMAAYIETGFDEDEIPIAKIVVTLKSGATCVYDTCTPTELRAAMDFVAPIDVGKREGLELNSDDCGLVGIDDRSSEKNGAGVQSAWFFSIHPAIANTIVAEDAMRLDMLLAHPKRDELIPELLGAELPTYQWYDDVANIESINGRVVVSSQGDINESLMRFRIWHRPSPDWVKGPMTFVDIQQHPELARRLKERAESVGILNTPSCRLALLPVHLNSIARELSEANVGIEEYKKRLTEQRSEYVKEHGIEGSDSWVLLESLRTVANAIGWSGATAGEIADLVGKSGEKQKPGFASTAAFLIWKTEQKLLEIPIDLANKTPDEIAHQREEDRIRRLREVNDFAAKQGLEETPEFKVWKLRNDVAEELLMETQPCNRDFDSTATIGRLSRQFGPLRRIDRFAKTVAVLRWIVRDTAKVPSINEPHSLRLTPKNVPPVFFFSDVLD